MPGVRVILKDVVKAEGLLAARELATNDEF